MPGDALRKMDIKEGEKVSIRKVPEAGGLIGQDVERAGEVAVLADVAMVALVEGLEAKEVGGGAGGGGRSFGLPGPGSSVVGVAVKEALADVKQVCRDVGLDDGGSKFEVGVGGRPGGVAEGDEITDNIGRERCTPDDWATKGGGGAGASRAGRKEDTAHAGAGGIKAAGDARGLGGDELVKARGARGNVIGEPLEVGQGIVDGLGEADAVVGGVPEGLLHLAEESARTR